MSFLLTRISVDDYETWKPMFDSDPVGARAQAKGHRILRGVDEPNEVFIQVEFDSPGDAAAALERLRAGGVLDRVKVKAGPTVAEEAETVAY
jgi:hypothetical protein